MVHVLAAVPAALYFAKISILCFYYRPSPKKLYRWSVYCLGGVITLYSTAMFFVNVIPPVIWLPVQAGGSR